MLDEGIREMALRTGPMDLSERTRARLVEYVQLLVRWNQKFNLVAAAAVNELVRRHVLDCLSPLPWLDANLPCDARLLDLGTGAGLPGLLLALARPMLDWTLLDANGKKTRFCIQAAAQLEAENVTVHHARIEAHRPLHPYDAVVSRAVTDLPTLVTLSRPVLAPSGRVIAMAGQVVDAHRAQWSAAGIPASAVELYVPGTSARHLVVASAPG